jgi:hypothetical protein
MTGRRPKTLNKGGKTPSEHMFSEAPQVTDIARSAFIFANVLRIRRSGSEQFYAQFGCSPNNYHLQTARFRLSNSMLG